MAKKEELIRVLKIVKQECKAIDSTNHIETEGILKEIIVLIDRTIKESD